MMHHARMATLLLLTLPLISCAQPNLLVVDQDGKPVEGATIIAAWPSFDRPVATTDEDGAARIDVSQGSSIQPEMLSFSVEKQGYQPVPFVHAQQPPPFRIVLRRAGP
jgi:hypothetical protein